MHLKISQKTKIASILLSKLLSLQTKPNITRNDEWWIIFDKSSPRSTCHVVHLTLYASRGKYHVVKFIWYVTRGKYHAVYITWNMTRANITWYMPSCTRYAVQCKIYNVLDTIRYTCHTLHNNVVAVSVIIIFNK